MPRRLSTSLLLIVLLTAAGGSRAQLAVGEVAPDFTLNDTTGMSHSLVGDYANQVVVLFFVGYG